MQYIELEAINVFWRKRKEIRNIRVSSIAQHCEKDNGWKGGDYLRMEHGTY